MSAASALAVRIAAVLAGLFLFPGASGAQTGPTITAVVEAASVGNSLNVYISNADSFATLSAVEIRAPTGMRFVTNVAVEPARIENLEPNSIQQVTVTFDIDPNVPDKGARETAVFAVNAAGGILDFTNLTLHLGIETEKTRLAIVPFVVGKSAEEASDMIGRASLSPEIEVTGRPPDPALYDMIAAQAIAAGTIVEVGATIGLTAYPPGLVAVPKVAGLETPEATRRVTDAGLKPKVTPLGDAPSEALANRVDRSEPSEGEQLEPGAAVSLLSYGEYRAPPPAEELPPPPVAGNWAQPWRGEIKLTLVIADGQKMSIAEALRRYSSEPEPEPEPTDPAAGSGRVLAAPGAVAAGTGAAIEAGVTAGAEVVGEMIGILFKLIEQGVPLSITIVEEQGGFRVGVPGSSDLVDELNTILADQLPLFLPEGGDLLRAKQTISDDNTGDVSFTFELTAAPDWQQLTVLVSVKGTNLKQTRGPSSLELALSGTLKPGLYEAAQYEADLTALFTSMLPK